MCAYGFSVSAGRPRHIRHSTRAPTMSDASRTHTRMTPRTAHGRRPMHGNRGALRRHPGRPVGGEVGAPYQPPPAPLNATTSTRGSLLAAVRAARRPPSRGRRRRDNDRPAPSGTDVQRGGFAVGTCVHKSPPRVTRNGNFSPFHSPKRCVRHSPRLLAVVKWYRIYAYWYKPDPPGLGEW